MGSDDDLARLLPDPPSPRPAARVAAIEAAMRRFDGAPEPATAPEHPGPARPTWLTGRGPVGVLASILLVALIGIPIALHTPNPHVAVPEQNPVTPPAGWTSLPATAPSAPPPAARPAVASVEAVPVAPPAAVAEPAAPVASATRTEDLAVAPAPAAPVPPPPPPPPAPAPPQAKMESQLGLDAEPQIVVAGQAQFSAPVTVVDSARLDNRREEVVVTGTRTSRGRVAASRRGDWNACTVADPEQSLGGCKALINPDAKGATGEAATHLSEGLDRAWRGDWKGAIAAFDQAIALRPRFAFAFLNRGMAWQQAGDSDRALADLDRAIRYAPNEARGFYQRSLVQRARGDARRADADARRAADLDPAYDALLD